MSSGYPCRVADLKLDFTPCKGFVYARQCGCAPSCGKIIAYCAGSHGGDDRARAEMET